MSMLGFADALSHAGVKWLAASPETMISPGVPTDVADAVAKNGNDPHAMGNAVVSAVMRQKYEADGMSWGPAAAFDVLDVDRAKMQKVETSVKALNDAIAAEKGNATARVALRDDGASTPGMVRFPRAPSDLPWHAGPARDRALWKDCHRWPSGRWHAHGGKGGPGFCAATDRCAWRKSKFRAVRGSRLCRCRRTDNALPRRLRTSRPLGAANP